MPTAVLMQSLSGGQAVCGLDCIARLVFKVVKAE